MNIIERVMVFETNMNNEQLSTRIKFDFRNVTNERLQEIAMWALVINKQTHYINDGNVPEYDSVIVAEYPLIELDTCFGGLR